VHEDYEHDGCRHRGGVCTEQRRTTLKVHDHEPSTADGQVTPGAARLLAALRTIHVEVLSLVGELALARRAYADLVAACRAGLLALRDGETDPWQYLAEELPPAPPGHPLHPAHSERTGSRGTTSHGKEPMPMHESTTDPATGAGSARDGGDAT
jgi:hypothetical protein